MHRLALTLALAAATLPALAQTSPQLAAVCTQMDAAAKRFHSATADVERDNYERIAHDTTRQTGTIFIDRSKSGIEFGATVSTVGAGANSARVVSYSGGILRMYTPAQKQVDIFKAGAGQGSFEGYFALGFGGTSADLTHSWTVTDAGPETLTDTGHPVRVEKLVLVSKDPAVRNTFTQITLWLDPTRDVSLKQLFTTPAGDTQTALYSNIKLNEKPNTNTYKIPTGKGITVVNH